MKQPLIIIGAGGHARVVISVALQDPCWEVAGVLDRGAPSAGERIGNISVIGSFEDAPQLRAQGIRHAVLAIGDNDERARMFEQFGKSGFEFPSLLHPSSIIESSVRVGRGTIICAGAIICAHVTVGDNVIINTGAIVDHESTVGDHSHVAPGCCVAGRVKIGRGVFLGIGSVVKDKITIGDYTIVGAGSVVVDNIPGGVVAYGCPARIQRPVQTGI